MTNQASTEVVDQTNDTLKNLNPEEFAIALFSPFGERATTAIAEIPDKGTYNIQTKEGLAIAKEQLKTFKDLRIESDRERKTYKEPILKTGKALDQKHKEFLATIEEHEERFALEVKQEKDRQDEIKAAKMRAIAEREAEVQANMDRISQAPLNAITMPLAKAQDLYAELEVMVPSKEAFDNRDVEAEAALKEALPKLKEVIDGRIAQEKMAAEAEAERLEAERTAAIQAKVASLNDYLTKAVVERTSKGVQTLIDQLNGVEITKAEYQEQLEEAEATKARVLDTIKAQLALIKQAEAAMAQAPAEEVQTIEPEPALRVVDPVADEAMDLAPEVEGVEAPALNEMVGVLADFYSADAETVIKWLKGYLQIQQAA